ncbi:amidase family protein [Ignicoccus hospitalis]|uniref:Glutamyl-tRNA(Gln) amidotransferase subunit A n=1 Tax=Ignicoccus hospitalis (strain KIN4/I / DSM 18386 / JCM 14125) TaxID=453591 RepID=A8AAZ4_IGNH4|nr:amidase family protein [Ignicoccus hospitalis]ABU82096.1 aspartyl/glutamyl-tRNA(Asn/Gln) amidotransferase subunit A [Ignicoccus hospitalis KIN4/I]HIH91054.1 Asp-tRNA(Asn)/Glu-tRNA(Gln) amidotransferase subunit GatA [Desulfurococcaceae archaeon]
MESLERLYDALERDELNAFITLRPREEVLREARSLLERGLRPKPVTIKDNISTKGIRTTAGSLMLKDYVPPFDATVIKRLKERGYVIVGKTNMDEFGMGSTGENSAFGPTKNPLDPAKVPGGSSSGAGAAARRYSLPGLGSDTGGSVRAPAAWCSAFGLKPTYGAVSRYGLIPYADSLEQISPIGPTVKSVEELLDVIAGYDEMDGTTVKRELRVKGCSEKGVEGLKLFVPSNALEYVDNDVKAEFNAALRKLSSEGAEVEEGQLPELEAALPAYYTIAMAEASSNLSRYDGIRYGLRDEDLPPITENFYEYVSEVRGKYFGWEVKRRIVAGATVLSAGYSEELYLKALKARRKISERIYEITEERLIVTPTMPVKPPSLASARSPKELFAMDVLTVFANLAGVPAGSAPVGEGVGLQVVGPRWGECEVLRVMGTFERKVDAPWL